VPSRIARGGRPPLRSDDDLALKDAVPLATRIRHELSEATVTRVEAVAPNAVGALFVRPHPSAPRYEMHSTPMTHVQGKHGPFWSCHQRNLDRLIPAKSDVMCESHHSAWPLLRKV